MLSRSRINRMMGTGIRIVLREKKGALDILTTGIRKNIIIGSFTKEHILVNM